MKSSKKIRHFENLGVPTPPADPFRWVEDQRVPDIATLQTAILHAADTFRSAETETPAEPFSALKGRILNEGDIVFTADITFHCKDHAVLAWQEIAAHIRAGQTSGDVGPDNTWSLRVGRTVTIIEPHVIWLRANFLSPSVKDLSQWLGEYAMWALNDRNPKTEPQPKTTNTRTADTFRFHCSLKETPRDMYATLLTAANKLCFRETASDKGVSGEWSYAKATPAPARVKTADPEWFIWAEEHRFESISAIIVALQQTAKAVVTAQIDCTGGYGSFSHFQNFPNSGPYFFRSYIQFGNREYCGECIRAIARQVGSGETEGTIGTHRWSLTAGHPEEFLAESTAPAPENPPKSDLPAAEAGESQPAKTAEIQKSAS